MKFKRERSSSPWLVQDLYLRDTWGDPFSVSRTRRFTRRRFFAMAMVIFGIFDLCLIALFIAANLLPLSSKTARRPAPPTAVAANEPTKFAQRPTRTPVPTQSAPTRAPTRPPTARPTRAPNPTTAPVAVEPENVVPVRTISFDLPASLKTTALVVEIPPEPVDCTPADVMPDVVNGSIKLCGGQSYRPFVVRGENIGVFGDKSSVIRAEGRAYGIIAEGARILIQNVLIRATTEPSDAATLLCLYPDCKGRPGGIVYGGGILVRAADTTIMDSDIAGGVAGVAAERVRGLKLINNRLDNSSGWGSYNFAVESSQFVGNSWSNNNRSCTTPDGGYLPTGCESAGWLCIACQQNIVARNTCTNSGDCFYMNGEGNLTSNYNRFHQNECRAAPHNCFEVTFSVGNEFVENIARDDPDTGNSCKYPFWIGGSQVIFARNLWSCLISADIALQHATASTHVPTGIAYR